MGEIFDISLPRSWADLTDRQLLTVYSLFARDLASYFSDEQMAQFRQVIAAQTPVPMLCRNVINNIRSLELLLLTDNEVRQQEYFDIVNVIRVHPETFPYWHASSTAQLYTPVVFENKKTSGGYWF